MYNDFCPATLLIKNWNRGIHIFFKHNYVHGDNAASFHVGNAMFTRGTTDLESKDKFYHRYVDSAFHPCCGSNGYPELAIYVKLR
jgi:hypothetical protein